MTWTVDLAVEEAVEASLNQLHRLAPTQEARISDLFPDGYEPLFYALIVRRLHDLGLDRIEIDTVLAAAERGQTLAGFKHDLAVALVATEAETPSPTDPWKVSAARYRSPRWSSGGDAQEPASVEAGAESGDSGGGGDFDFDAFSEPLASAEYPPEETVVVVGSDRFAVVDVHFATDRLPVAADSKKPMVPRFGGDQAGKLTYGACQVSVPLKRKKGAFPRPRWWKFEFKENPDKHSRT